MDVDSSYIIESELGKETEEKIERIIGKYKEKTPSESGLLTSIHYVVQKWTGYDLANIVHRVQKIVGTKYSEEAIKETVNELGLLIVER